MLQFKTAKLQFRMFKVDSLKVMRAMLERIKLQEQGLSIQLEMQGQMKPGQPDVVIAMVKIILLSNDFLADSLEETDDCEDLQLQPTVNFKAGHVDAYDSDYDDEAITNAIFMENLSPVGSINDYTVEPRYDSDILSEVPHYNTYHDSDMLNSNIQELGLVKPLVLTIVSVAMYGLCDSMCLCVLLCVYEVLAINLLSVIISMRLD
ncbi:hypothetical protein Tco_0266187 [Tanacetum coccineum]